MVSKHPEDENRFGGKWSVKKLECVENYLDAYLTVMSNQDWAKLWYIDAFSGDGYQRLRAEESGEDNPALFDMERDYASQLLKGSAIRAIRLSQERERAGLRSFENFVFLEFDDAKMHSLEATIAEEYPDQLGKCQFILGDANTTLPRLLSELNWRCDRAVTFVDPCATQLKWNAIEAFKGTCSDVWLLFPLSAILRMMPKESIPSGGLASSLDELFGSSSWRSVYQAHGHQQLRLFDSADLGWYRESGIEKVIAFATERFQTVFPEVNGPAILRTEKNSPLFALYSMVANDSVKARKISRDISADLIRKIGE